MYELFEDVQALALLEERMNKMNSAVSLERLRLTLPLAMFANDGSKNVGESNKYEGKTE